LKALRRPAARRNSLAQVAEAPARSGLPLQYSASP
jgi:hypothetical protein